MRELSIEELREHGKEILGKEYSAMDVMILKGQLERFYDVWFAQGSEPILEKNGKLGALGDKVAKAVRVLKNAKAMDHYSRITAYNENGYHGINPKVIGFFHSIGWSKPKAKQSQPSISTTYFILREEYGTLDQSRDIAKDYIEDEQGTIEFLEYTVMELATDEQLRMIIDQKEDVRQEAKEWIVRQVAFLR